MDLTERQIQILKAIIEEYIETAQPVGSETLEKKYNLSVSPATIRHEMVELTKIGYLKKLHKSGGRAPTPMGLKYYVRHLLKPEELPVAEEVSVKQKIWDYRHQFDRLLKEATKALAEKSKALAVSATDEGDFYYAGVANILDFPEFYDIDLTKNLLSLLDRFDYWENLFRKAVSEDPFYLLLGEELGESLFEPCGFLYTRFKSPNHQGVMGIVGPCRFEYQRLIPLVRHFGELMSEIG